MTRRIERDGSTRYWALYDGAALVVVTVDKQGALEVQRRLEHGEPARHDDRRRTERRRWAQMTRHVGRSGARRAPERATLFPVTSGGAGGLAPQHVPAPGPQRVPAATSGKRPSRLRSWSCRVPLRGAPGGEQDTDAAGREGKPAEATGRRGQAFFLGCRAPWSERRALPAGGNRAAKPASQAGVTWR